MRRFADVHGAMHQLAAVELSRMTDSSSAGALGGIAAVLVVALAVVALILVVRTAGQRKLVTEASTALQQLLDLNARSSAHIAQQPSISTTFRYRAESKSKFDRFDLQRFLTTSVLDNEGYFEQEVSSRIRATELYSAYRTTVERQSEPLLATSSHPKVKQARFIRIERRLFERVLMSPPTPKARVIAQVAYTSPKGQNSYSRGITWDFELLRDGLRSAQAVRAQQSTAAALRARERSLMTFKMRSDILRRDAYRCKMCGATGGDGVELHVDHILPVSRGGRTVVENLQTLCAPCNLGKGNRFVG